jgi:predicted Abi (CAAX) family protease
MAATYGSYPSTTRDIEKTPPNEAGWYVYGAKDAGGQFIVQAIAPRCLLRLQPDQVLLGEKADWDYLKHHAWKVEGQKGKTSSVLLLPFLSEEHEDDEPWKEGDRALVVHTYGGIGGKNREPAAKGSLFLGHFSYGAATVVREPLADELIFDIVYYQVYTHNVDGITSCPTAWFYYMGDRQVGWMGSRPVCDVLIKHNAFTGAFSVHGATYSVLDILIEQLEQMMARYRIGDGTGGTYVTVAYNCSQDSNQAFYRAMKLVGDAIRTDPQLVQELQDDPGEAERYQQLFKLTVRIRDQLLPFGSARADWQNEQDTLGITPGQNPIRTILTGLQSWRTLLPRVASEVIARQFIHQKASLWVLRTNQVGGYDPDIEPIPLTPFG